MLSKKSGFTLVELSIVLVIIGLIVGGVVGGQALIKSARLNSVASDINKYKTALRAYSLQYDALPGDHSEAQNYFGSTACPNNAGANVICNGNGDGVIRWKTAHEDWSVWHHMSLAKVIPGLYTGDNYTLGTGRPASKISGAGYWLRSSDLEASPNYILVGAAGGSYPNGAVFTPAEAKALDKKMDDGKRATGIVGASNGNGVIGCNDSYVYNLDNPNVVCTLGIQIY